MSELSDRLDSQKTRIMQQWEERAYEEVASAYGLTSLVLRDHLGEVLDQLVERLSHTEERTRAEKKSDRNVALTSGQEHALQRLRIENYTIEELIREYQILRQVIFKVLGQVKPLSDDEREHVIQSIEQAVNDSATYFSERLLDIQSQFILTLSHDLRTPMSSAKASAQLMIKQYDNPDLCLKSAVRVVDSVNRMEKMIHDLLDTGRIRAGQGLSLKFEELDVDGLVREVAEDFSQTHEASILIVSEGPLSGYWSRDGLRRAIENLLNNAIKYGDATKPITVTVKSTPDPIKIIVHNIGKMIPVEEQKSLFQRFRRAETAQEKGPGGWGLGLTVVKGVAEAHHGKAFVESSETNGTSFTMELPRDFRSEAAQ